MTDHPVVNAELHKTVALAITEHLFDPYSLGPHAGHWRCSCGLEACDDPEGLYAEHQAGVLLAITEADKAEAVRAALAEHRCGWREIKRGEECPHCDDLKDHPGGPCGPCGDYYGDGDW